MRSLFLIALCLLPLSRADVRACLCDVAVPETLAARECSLCKEAEKQPTDLHFFYLKDISPTKPNRWLALPRLHGGHPQMLTDLTAEQRTAYWTAAIAKARELWPKPSLGIALNSTEKRSQCHIHLHIGRLLTGIPDENFVIVDAPASIPAPQDGGGIWIHPVNGRLHVHTGVHDGELNLEKIGKPMLVEITKVPNAENSAIQLHPSDNVAIARVPIAAGAELRISGHDITTLHPIPAGHKVALLDIAQRETLIRYGQVIGRAKVAIQAGSHVHLHNLGYEELTLHYEFPTTEVPIPGPRADAPTFMGYQRDDGRVGTRNYIAVVAASNCAAHTAELIARSYEGVELPPNVDGIVAFPHGDGCGHAQGPDIVQLRRTLSGVLMHPNVSAAVVLGLGCEDNQITHYLGADGPRTNRLSGMTLQDSGGTTGVLEASRRDIARFIEQAAAETRVECSISKLILGLNCGGSDSFSGITANPALGHCSDLLAEYGGTSVLAETPEIFGAEHLLVKRARNRAVAEKLLGFVRGYKEYLGRFQGNFDDNPSPGNKEGGLTNILEKSLGAVAKGGTSILNDVYDYAERITGPGFTFMNTPGYDPVSLSGLAAGGCNLIAFTTGRGSAIGFPTIPVIKIATNSNTYRAMLANMDVNAGAISDGEATVQQVGRQIFDALLDIASGRRTCAERLGHKEFVPWRIGPVV